ncbi:MAG: hypothetical protein QW587_04750 [Candidatus Bathyarchaeia archaeon]
MIVLRAGPGYERKVYPDKAYVKVTVVKNWRGGQGGVEVMQYTSPRLDAWFEDSYTQWERVAEYYIPKECFIDPPTGRTFDRTRPFVENFYPGWLRHGPIISTDKASMERFTIRTVGGEYAIKEIGTNYWVVNLYPTGDEMVVSLTPPPGWIDHIQSSQPKPGEYKLGDENLPLPEIAPVVTPEPMPTPRPAPAPTPIILAQGSSNTAKVIVMSDPGEVHIYFLTGGEEMGFLKIKGIRWESG